MRGSRQGSQAPGGTCVVAALMLLLSAGLAREARAQGPLNIEQLLVKARRWQVTAGIDHYGRSFSSLDEQIDRAISAAVRYGLRSGIELNARYIRAGRQRRFPGVELDSRQDSLTLGLNLQLRAEDRWPAAVLELRGQAWQEQDGRRTTLPGASLAVILYRSIDPVVLSLRGSYRRQRSSRGDRGHIRPGDAWQVEPMVNFAVNPQVTLIGGLGLSRRAAAQIDGQRFFTQRYRRELLAGVGYAPRPGSTIFLIGSHGDGATGSGISLQWLREIL